MKARKALAAMAAGAAIILATTHAAAISSGNSFPAPERTEVGFLGTALDFNGDGTLDALGATCSGTMIDSDTFLTAAHCTDQLPGGERFFVSLEEDVLTPFLAHAHLPVPDFIAQLLAAGLIVEGDARRDPGFTGSPQFPNSSDQHDIAVMDFADRDATPADLWSFTPASLPSAGLLDEIGRHGLDDHDWWAVGYGSPEAVRGPGGLTHPLGLIRSKAQLEFTTLRSAWVQLAMNASRDLGGVCYGDSGGPNYLDFDGTLILAAVTSWGDIPCYATAVQYRTDTPSARDFLADYVDLP